jgi:hypothetical protein
MATEEELIDQIIIAESKEEFDESAKLLGEIAKAYGYECEMTGDGNWILMCKKENASKIEVMFDSGRGGDIPIDFEADGETTVTKYENPDTPRKIIQMCIEFMKKHRSE